MDQAIQFQFRSADIPDPNDRFRQTHHILAFKPIYGLIEARRETRHKVSQKTAGSAGKPSVLEDRFKETFELDALKKLLPRLAPEQDKLLADVQNKDPQVRQKLAQNQDRAEIIKSLQVAVGVKVCEALADGNPKAIAAILKALVEANVFDEVVKDFKDVKVFAQKYSKNPGLHAVEWLQSTYWENEMKMAAAKPKGQLPDKLKP